MNKELPKDAKQIISEQKYKTNQIKRKPHDNYLFSFVSFCFRDIIVVVFITKIILEQHNLPAL